MHKEAAVQPKCHTAASKRLQNDAVLEDGDLAEAVLLGLGLLTACNADDQIQQILCGLVDGLFAIGDHAGVEVDPAGFLLGQRGVGGDLQGGSRGRERVPRPVEKRIRCAPAAVMAVAETRSLPGPYSMFRPLVTTGSP